MKYLKVVSIWVLCFILSIFLLVGTRPDHRVTVGTATLALIIAPVMVIVGTVVYVADAINWDKCLFGCEK